MTEPTDDQLRDIARKATGTGYYSGGVKALRAVWNAARAGVVAEEPEWQREERYKRGVGPVERRVTRWVPVEQGEV